MGFNIRKFSVLQEGTQLSVNGVENQHEKDLLLHIIDKNNLPVGRTIYLQNQTELIVNTLTYETTSLLVEFLCLNGAL